MTSENATHPDAGTDTGYAAAERHRQRLAAICERVREIAEGLEPSAVDGANEILSRVENDAFRIMVLGNFKRGKSTLVNALLGDELLPSFARPCTAVPTELSYGETPSVVLHDLDSGDVREVPIEELENRISIAAEDPDALNPYRLAEVRYPLPLLANGVTLIDSPGLNEHPNRQRVSLEYLARADAIVFVTDANAPWAQDEQHFARVHLVPYDLFVVVNRINQIRRAEVDSVKQSTLHRHRSARGERADNDRVFFVDALLALESRIGNEPSEGWRESGVAAFAEALDSTLLRERHRHKIIAPARSIRSVLRNLSSHIPDQLDLLDGDERALRQRFDEAQAPLRVLEQEAAKVILDARTSVARICDLGERQTMEHFRALARDASDIVDAASAGKAVDVSGLSVKAKASVFAGECYDAAVARIQLLLAAWNREQLAPLLEGEVDELISRLERDLERFDADLSTLRANLVAGDESRRDQADAPNLDSIALGTTFEVSAQDVDTAAGSRAASAILGGVGIAVLVAGGWVAAIPFGIASAVFGDKAKDRAERKARQQAADALGTDLLRNGPEHAQALRLSIEHDLEPIVVEVTRRTEGRVGDLRAAVEQALAERTAGESTVQARRADLRRLDRELDETLHELDELIGDVALL